MSRNGKLVRISVVLAAVAAVTALAVATAGTASAKSTGASVNGAGSTFVAPLVNGWINPVKSALGISLKLSGNAVSYRGEVYDLTGRRVRSFSGMGNRSVVWNGRTEQGDLVRPGMYFIRVESGGKSAFARVVLLR